MAGVRNTPEGLPIVSEESWEVFERDIDMIMEEDRTSEYILEVLKRIRRDNPNLPKHLAIMSYQYESEDDLGIYSTGFATCYELLRRQAETNKFEREVGG
jgi:hypothetical protein